MSSAAIWSVNVGGTTVRDDVMKRLVYGLVEDNLRLPDMFVLSFLDEGRSVIADGGFSLGEQVAISAYDEGNQSGERLFIGEITAMEAQLEGGVAYAVIRGFDKSNRLYRGRRSRVFVDVKYDDIVKEVASGAGLDNGQVDSPSGPARKHVAQAGISDAEFLEQLAGEVGFIVGVEDGKVNFHQPPQASDAPAGGTYDGQSPLQLVPGTDLLQFSAVVTADSAVKEVEVRGWDLAKKEPVVGKAAPTATTASIGATPAQAAAAFGNPVFTAADVPFDESTQVEGVAKALATQIAGAHAQLYGMAVGNPKLHAGVAVSLGQSGEPFNGKYTLSLVRHVYDGGDYRTHFSSTGVHDRSLHSMMGDGGANTFSPAFVTGPIQGVVPGIVDNVKQGSGGDPESLGRVKVKIPQLGDDFVTDWLRVAQPGVGKNRGMVLLPEVGDEVIVAFERGDVRRGYVLGGVFNGKDKPDQPAFSGAVGSDGRVDKRSITSRNGHFVLISDKQGEEFVEVATKDSKYSIKLDQDGKAILVTSDKVVSIDALGDIQIKSDGKISIEAAMDLTLKGQKVSIEAQTDVAVKGLNVKIEGSAQTEMKGAQTKVAGSAMLDLDGGAMAQLKGGMVKIN